MIQPLFLLSDVPGDVAYAVAGLGLITIGALWRQHLKDQAVLQENIRQDLLADHATADGMAAVARALEALGGNHDAAKRSA